MTNEELTALEKASYNGDDKLISDLINLMDGKKNFDDYKLKSSVRQFIQKENYQILNALIDKGLIETDLYEYDRFNGSVIEVLIHPGITDQQALSAYLDWLPQLLNKIDDIDEEVSGVTLLQYALGIGAPLGSLQKLVACGADIHQKDKYDQSLLYHACSVSTMNVKNVPEIVAWLLQNGVEVDAANVENRTPLCRAVSTGNISLLNLLLENGADPSVQDWKGENAFYHAAVHLHNKDMVKLLLQYQTPDWHMLTKQNENLLNAFLRVMLNGNEDDFEILELFLENGADPEMTSQYYSAEKSGLDWIAEKPFEVMERLLEKGYFRIDYQDNEGNTLLHKVCRFNVNYEEKAAKDLYRKVKLLLKAGTDPNVENTADKKAVDYAMEDNLKTKTVELLLNQ
ncbi:ankyrin repeat domain-containing protein [Sphingobacterium spiritivorum]|uniref:ankyrin repeat domain-containing protein n=1 Tax=Sphingobacterium spiritivorum TaxID=258 RepID=UPI003DA2588A